MSSDPSVAAKPPNQEFATLGHLIHALLLIDNGTVPLPEHEEWTSMITRINRFGVVNEISKDTYDYFLDVLPPKYMGRGIFAFAEGAEPLRLFIRITGRFFCRRLDEDQTRQFCRLTGIQIPW